MAEIDLEKFYDKLNEIKSEFNKGLNAVNLKVAEVIVEFKNLKTHDAPCQFLEDHKKDQSKRSKDIYDKLDEHVKDHHSSNSENTPDKVISEHIEKYHSSNAANTAEKIMSDHVQKEHSAESSDRKKTMLYTALCAIAAVAGVIAGVMIK